MKKTKKDSREQRLHQGRHEDQMLWSIARLGRLRFWFLASRYDARLSSAIYVFASSFLCMAILGLAAMWSSWQLIFPSLGPTMFLQFYAPSLASSSPRNTVAGHLIGVAVGTAAFLAGRWLHLGQGGLGPGQVFLAAAALGISGSVMAFTRLVHPPAASTTLIAALGMVDKWQDVAAVAISALMISMVAWLLHWLSGVKFPLWHPTSSSEGPVIDTKLGRLDVSVPQGESGARQRDGSQQDTAARAARRLRARQRPS